MIKINRRPTQVLIFVFLATLIVYPLIVPITWITGIQRFGAVLSIAYIGILGSSLMILLSRKRFEILLLDVIVLMYIVLVFVGSIRTEGLSVSGAFDPIRYRILFIVGIAALFKLLYLEKVDMGKFGHMIFVVTFWGGLIVVFFATIEFFWPDFVHKMYGDSLTVHLKTILGNHAYRRIISTMRNPINMAFYLSLSTLSGVYLYFVSRGLRRIFTLASINLFLVAILFSYSRSAYLVVAFGICIFLVGWFIDKGLRSYFSMRSAAVGVMITFVVVTCFLLSPEYGFGERVLQISAQSIASNPRTERVLEAYVEEASLTVTPGLQSNGQIATDPAEEVGELNAPVSTLDALEKDTSGIDILKNAYTQQDPPTFSEMQVPSEVSTDDLSKQDSIVATPIVPTPSTQQGHYSVGNSIYAPTGTPGEINTDELVTEEDSMATSQDVSVQRFQQERKFGMDSVVGLLFGHGIGNISEGSQQYVFEFGYASLTYETGVASLLIFAVMILLSSYNLYGSLRQKLCSQDSKLMALTMFSIVAAFALAMIPEDTYMQMPFSLYYPIAMYTIAYIYKTSRKSPQPSTSQLP